MTIRTILLESIQFINRYFSHNNVCFKCGTPERRLWACGHTPKLAVVRSGSYMFLERCTKCTTLWSRCVYEPYSSFEFLAAWPYDEATWSWLHGKNGATLFAWHDAMIRTLWTTLPANERESIEAWRKRSYYNGNPIDLGNCYRPEFVMERPEELARYFEPF